MIAGSPPGEVTVGPALPRSELLGRASTGVRARTGRESDTTFAFPPCPRLLVTAPCS